MSTKRHVVVTTEFRGVFFGEFKEESGRILTLENARNCVSWSSECKGVFGLAANGPTDNCRVGPAVPRLTLRGVTSVSDCTKKAVRAWGAAPWS